MRSPRLPQLFATLLLIGCQAADNGETSGTGSASESGDPAPETIVDCAPTSPCGLVGTFVEGTGSPPPTAYTDAQTCALEALVDGTPARLDVVGSCEPTCLGASTFLLGDGRAIRQGLVGMGGPDAIDIGPLIATFDGWEDTELCDVKATAYFQACLDSFDIACVSSSWLENCQPIGSATCDP